MSSTPAAASSSVVLDLADSWHRLAGAQSVLTHTEGAARDDVAIEPLKHETVQAFDTLIDVLEDRIVVRVTPHVGRPERLHVWGTPELLIVRTEAGDPIEHLIRLP